MADDLRRRVAKLERVLGRDGEKLLGVVAEAVGVVIAEERAETRRRFAEVEAARLKFMGVHEPGRWYSPGNLAVRGGSLWHCNADTRDTPGTSKAWQLAVKNGEVKKEPTCV
jgi:hypothetical protein